MVRSSGFTGAVKDWFESAYEINTQRCLQAGAAHELLKNAGFDRCWRCHVTFTGGVRWDDARILNAIVPCPIANDTAWMRAGMADSNVYLADLPRPLHVINAIESDESAE